MSEIVDTVTSLRGGNGPAARPTVTETVEADGQSPAVTLNRAGIEEERFSEGGRKGRVLKESTQKLLEQFDQERVRRARVDAGEIEDDGEEAVVETASDPDDVGLVDEVKTETAEKIEEPVVDQRFERLESANRKLTEELETERKRPRGDMNDRLKALDEAEKAYVDDGPVAAFRRFLAVVLNAAPDSKEVDSELSGAYVDLTARELNVPLEAAHQATREAARTRLALARDRRERKAEAEATAKLGEKDTDTQQAEQASTFIGNRLTTVSGEYPMLMALAEELDGMKPSMLIWRTMQRETKIGNLDPALGDDALINAAAKLLENNYQRLAERLGKAKPSTTDTTTSEPVAKTVSKDQHQGKAVRTITNANASVAPATSPKQKTSKQPEEKPKFKSDKERREFLLKKHFPNG